MIWNGFTLKNSYYFETFLIAYYFSALPRKGGTDQQDPETMKRLIMLYEIFSISKEKRELAMHKHLALGMFGR